TSATFSSGIGYTTTATTSTTIPANGHLDVTVDAPAIPQLSAVPGNYADTLTIVTDIAGDAPHTLPLTESALGAILAWDTSATANFGSFGSVPAGTSLPENFKVVNTGNAPSVVTLSTTAPFGIGTPSFTVTENSSQDDTVSFAPT